MTQVLGVVGFGTMGSEIALLGACAGYSVRVCTRDGARFDATKLRLGKLLRVAARDDRFFAAQTVADDAGREDALSRLVRVDSLDAFAEAGAVVESVPEDSAVKREVFAALAAVTGPDCLLATNTSSISITEIAGAAAGAQERVVGMHFFNPPLQMALVEVIPGLLSSEAAVAQALQLAGRLGKKAIRVKETPGFVVNRVLTAMMNEAIKLLEEGAASAQEIDEAMKLGAGFPLGPFKLADLVGLDVYMHTCDSIHKELGREAFMPPPLLRQLVRAGRLGRKTRHGFYKY